MDIEQARQDIITIGRKLTSSGAIGALEGNISVKVNDRIVMTPTGKSKEDLLADQLALTDLDGKWLKGPFKPTSETPMHTAIYRYRPDITAIVHTHSPFATAFAMANEDIEIRSSIEFAVFFRKVPVLPYGLTGTDEIYRGIDKLLVDHNAVLLANHGLICVGKTLNDAYNLCASLELILKTYTINRVLFPDRNCDLPQEELERLWKLGEPKRGMH